MWRVSAKLGRTDRVLKRIALRQGRPPLFMRVGASSDFGVFTEVFLDDELGPLRRISPPRVIVDCGANVGYASRYLLDMFPAAKLVAIEPSPDNAQMCQANLAPYRDRSAMRQAAVWAEVARLHLLRGGFGDGREWATQVKVASNGDLADVTAIDIPTLMLEEAIDTIDLLKIDIEGAELDLFRSKSCKDWLNRVRNLTVELHGPECARAFFDAMAGFKYILLRSGELHLCLNIEPLPTAVGEQA